MYQGMDHMGGCVKDKVGAMTGPVGHALLVTPKGVLLPARCHASATHESI